MKQYRIAPIQAEFPALGGVEFDPEVSEYCRRTEYAPIESYAWDAEGYRPEARAYVTWSEQGLHVLLCAREREINVETRTYNGDVYRDSCLEFFLQPFQDDPRYLNFETNAEGVALIGLGEDRFSRSLLEEKPEGVEIAASRHCGGWWAVGYTVPFDVFRRLYGREPGSGDVMRGNFYKCDESIHPHFGSWNPIVCDHPDFHRPECFGEMVLVPVSGV